MNQRYTRRHVLKQLSMIGGAVLLLPTAGDAQPENAGWAPAGSVADYKVGATSRVTLPPPYDHLIVLITRQEDGSFTALTARCTHRGCIVDWEEDRRLFVCPCQGGIFDAAGTNIGGPAPRPLTKLPTKIAHGILYIASPA